MSRCENSVPTRKPPSEGTRSLLPAGVPRWCSRGSIGICGCTVAALTLMRKSPNEVKELYIVFPFDLGAHSFCVRCYSRFRFAGDGRHPGPEALGARICNCLLSFRLHSS